MAARDFQREAVQEDAVRGLYREWIGLRIENIHRLVTAHDVLSRNGVELFNSDKEQQISCPFHGRDNKPSARVYPESAKGPSGVWCFVCNQQWDAIALWRKFNDATVKFTVLLREIENAFGLDVPPQPEHSSNYEDTPEAYAEDELRGLLDLCDRRLKGAFHAFDIQGFLKTSVALDRIRAQVESRLMKYDAARPILDAILEKISVKKQQCPED